MRHYYQFDGRLELFFLWQGFYPVYAAGAAC